MPPPHRDPSQSLTSDDPAAPSTRPVPALHYAAPPPPPPPLPPETYNYLIHALLSLQGSAARPFHHSHSPPYPYPAHAAPFPNVHYPWPPGTAPPPSAAFTSVYPTSPPVSLAPQGVDPLQPTTLSPAAPLTTAPAPQDPEGTEDAVPITEEKRRRNTAASARFRVKKKLKTLNLEHTVTDLAGRAEELEREAADLRRENAWLKEIVLLKGRNLAAVNGGSQAPAPAGRHDEGEKDARVPEPESAVKLGGQGNKKEKEGGKRN